MSGASKVIGKSVGTGLGIASGPLKAVSENVGNLTSPSSALFSEVKDTFTRLDYLEGTPLDSLSEKMLQKTPAELANIY